MRETKVSHHAAPEEWVVLYVQACRLD